MAARTAPALGLTAACLLLSAVGVATIEFAPRPVDRASSAGSVLRADAAVAIAQAAGSSVPRPAASATPSGHRGGATALGTGASGLPTSATPRTSAAGPASAGTPAAAAPAVTGTVASRSAAAYAQAVFIAINQARAEAYLRPLSWSPALAISAHRHNLAMASANTLAHQVGSEPGLARRETAAGLRWTFAAENIGWSTARTRSGALGIERSMVSEAAPNDQHRGNILSSRADSVGIDVLIDVGHNRLWLTEDFTGNS